MNAILIGFRGIGKSTVAELVASCTNRALYRTDEAVAKRAGRAIPDFVRAQGWEAFWALEAAVAHEAAGLTNTVIDTGGGFVQRPENMALLKATGPVFWLTAHVETIQERLKADGERCSITGRKSFLEEVAEVLEAREPLYAAVADFIVETDGRTPAAIAGEIVDRLCE